MTFVTACRADEIADGQLKSVQVTLVEESLPVMIGRIDGQWQAYLNICPHQGRMLNYAPDQFLIKDQQVICAAHGAVFNLTDGLCTGGPCKGSWLQPLACRETDGVVEVSAPADRS